MAQVNVTISGKTYRMACDDGQEEHLAGLADQLDRLIEDLRGRFGEIGDQRLTVMAAITLADRQAAIEERLDQLEAAGRSAEAVRGEARARQVSAEHELAGSLAAFAERIERIAALVSGRAADSEAP